jgi:hypothetical protein
VSARTPSAAATAAGVRRSVPVLGLTALALLAGLVVAGPAAAVDDLARPDARVTHGPSCRPGGVVVEVVAGTVPAAVTLATTRTPSGEDSVELPAGGTAVLRTGEVAWGETIDGRLEYRALDGSGDTWVDELEGYSFTRPAEEDCAAITAPAAPATVPGTPRVEDAPAPGSVGGGPAASGSAVPETGVAEPAVPGAGSAEPAAAEPDDAEPGVPGSVVPEAPGGPRPAREIEPGAGTATPDGGTATVEAVAVTPVPAAAASGTPVGPLFAAAVALGVAMTGLVTALGFPGRRRRPPTPGA